MIVCTAIIPLSSKVSREVTFARISSRVSHDEVTFAERRMHKDR